MAERMFSTRFFELYLKESDFSTENSFAYYDYYFLIPYVYYLGGKSAHCYFKKQASTADIKNDSFGSRFYECIEKRGAAHCYVDRIAYSAVADYSRKNGELFMSEEFSITKQKAAW